MSGNWCNVRKVFELRDGENASYVDLIAAVAGAQDRARRAVGEASAYPPSIPHHTARWMNYFGIEPHELDDWNRLKRSRQYNSAEAADIIIRSRRGEQRP